MSVRSIDENCFYPFNNTFEKEKNEKVMKGNFTAHGNYIEIE